MNACFCIELESYLLLAPCPPFGADQIFWELMNQLADGKITNRSILTYNETRILARHCNISERITKETASPEMTSTASSSAETTSVPSSTYIYLIIGIGCTIALIALLMAMIILKICFYKRKVGEADTNVLECSNLSAQGEDMNKLQSDGHGKQHNKKHVSPCILDNGPPDIGVINQTNNEIQQMTPVSTLTRVEISHHSNKSYKSPSRILQE
ncbi:hypothetical protein CHS0354_004314 [Potamilus streckersoni]|uniref:Uncharacterized protein n=1 Tax=Potamilus streckersoni TaxID=2493646 RepID=A0AAE0VUL5_9BIVA|nr:hypothetical protein CHS0354_004314 [Potamilus streckersoni]